MAEPRRVGNLPVEVTSFVGRRRELAEGARLVAASRLVTVVGCGGVGKTRLAMRVAAGAYRAFPDGLWFVPLESVPDPALLDETVASALGLRSQSLDPADRLAAYLADKRLLLVLDNCEHLAPACGGLIARLLAGAPGLRVLATSRHVLGIHGEQILSLPPLSLPTSTGEGEVASSEAVTLFAERAAAVDPEFRIKEGNREAVIRICRWLDGVPLGIELAAVRLRALSVAQVDALLDGSFRLLTEGSRTALPRHRALRAAFDWSYQLCLPAERLLWTRLSVFSGGFDLEGAEQVCQGEGIARDAVLDLVSGLLNESILTRQEPTRGDRARYRMLDVIRRYGRTTLVDSGREALFRTRHRDYFRRLVRDYDTDWFGPRQVEWLLRLRDEHANLREALDFCLAESGQAQAALEITGGLRTYWIACGLIREGRGWLGRALDAAPQATPARGRALFAAGYLAIMAGEPDAARAMLVEGRTLAERFADRALLDEITRALALIAFQRGDHAKALAMTERALASHRAGGDLAGLSNTLFQKALVEAFREDPKAVVSAEECVALCHAHSAGWSRAYALWVLGLARFEADDPRGARAPLQESLRRMRELDDTMGIAQCLETLAWCAAAQGLEQRAVRLLGATRMVYRSSGARISEVTESHRAQLDRHEERLRRALGDAAYQKALDEGESFTVARAIDDALEHGAAATSERVRAGPSRPDNSPLTTREWEIAQLVRDGLSNRAIAQRLVIAQRTAETHVENILNKLGFASRAQIAAWMAADHHEVLRVSCPAQRIRMPVRKHTHRHR